MAASVIATSGEANTKKKMEAIRLTNPLATMIEAVLFNTTTEIAPATLAKAKKINNIKLKVSIAFIVLNFIIL